MPLKTLKAKLCNTLRWLFDIYKVCIVWIPMDATSKLDMSLCKNNLKVWAQQLDTGIVCLLTPCDNTITHIDSILLWYEQYSCSCFTQKLADYY